MTIQLSTAVRNARLDQIESTIGTSPILQLRTGAQPADCATADSGTLIAQMTLPSDWAAAAASGSKAKSGTWSDAAADNSGTPAHFRIKDSGGSTCHMQGSVGQGSGDLSLDNTTIVAGQQIDINTFTLNEANP